MEHNYYLAHHGVKGQKWGVRNVRKVRNGKQVSKRTLKKERKFKQKHAKDSVVKFLKKNGYKGIEAFHEDEMINTYKKAKVKKTIKRSVGLVAGLTVAGVGTYGLINFAGKALSGVQINPYTLAELGIANHLYNKIM